MSVKGFVLIFYLGSHEQYGYIAYMKKEDENDATLRVKRHLKQYYDVVLKAIIETELYEL